MFFRFPFYEIFPWRTSSFFLGTCIFPVDQSLWFVWMSVDNERYGSSRLCHITTAAASYETVNVDLSHCPNIARSMGVETHFRNDLLHYGSTNPMLNGSIRMDILMLDAM